MTAAPRRIRPRPKSTRFRIAPVTAGGAVWDDAVDLVLAPIRLAAPVRVNVAPAARGGAR